MALLEQIHSTYVANRRVRVLTRQFADLLPQHSHVIDVGCGDGLLAHEICLVRPDVRLRGIDVLDRARRHIHVELFDGVTIPFKDDSFQVAMLVDVLHHAKDPRALLAECARVASKHVVVKDHLLEGFLAGPILRFMDRLGNERHGVTLPYKYLRREEWFEAFRDTNLQISTWKESLKLYPFPGNWIFDRSLHFMAMLDIGPTARASSQLDRDNSARDTEVPQPSEVRRGS